MNEIDAAIFRERVRQLARNANAVAWQAQQLMDGSHVASLQALHVEATALRVEADKLAGLLS